MGAYRRREVFNMKVEKEAYEVLQEAMAALSRIAGVAYLGKEKFDIEEFRDPDWPWEPFGPAYLMEMVFIQILQQAGIAWQLLDDIDLADEPPPRAEAAGEPEVADDAPND
jgi:hypothetical protein